MKYDASVAASFFDGYGEREWTRFDGDGWPASLATHIHYLDRFVRDGDRVLDAGCGPGRFTIELARIGARVVAVDVSPGQLDLHRRFVPDDAVETRIVADVVDLSAFADGEFDATVCYGGPLSYVIDEAPRAVAELARVTRSGGHVLVSVMSIVGATLSVEGGVARLVRDYGEDVVRQVTRTGLLPSAYSGGHLDMRLYRWRELRELLAPHGTIVAAAATGMFRGDQAPPDLLVELELELSSEPGAVDSGNHILAVLEVA